MDALIETLIEALIEPYIEARLIRSFWECGQRELAKRASCSNGALIEALTEP